VSGIYLHIPFCKQACTYCDFFFSTNLSSKENLVKALIAEISLKTNYLVDKQVDSVYFGGGTPSLLSKEELTLILSAIKNYFSFNKGIEITLEVNPDDVNEHALAFWLKAGINRLSIGLQSFDEAELRWMNRAHSATESTNAVKLAQDAGFKNITIDLIYGSKFQNLETWKATLEKAIALNTQHISSYNLTIENKTALGVNWSKGKEPAVSDELSSKQFELMVKMLTDAGFEHYEISNFAKPGFYAKHNSNYWLQQHYLGIGPSAHSFNGISRQWNVKNNIKYIKAIHDADLFFEKEALTIKDRFNEYVLTRLRTIWGCNLKEIETQFGKDAAQHFELGVSKNTTYFEIRNGIYTLSSQAKLLADGIAADLFI
jgi:oxygen-independent coproporphyrinogen III oxidase